MTPFQNAEPPRGSASILAPAKINLALHVTGRRDDGFHMLETLAVFASAGDRLTIVPAASDSYEVVGPGRDPLPARNDNLEPRARDLLRSHFGDDACPPVAIRLEKHLPVAAGLGGGSADAAATLLALSELWDLPLDADNGGLAKFALSLGADIPMCLQSRTVIAAGIGERLTPVEGWPSLAIVLVNSGEKVSTADVFGKMEKPDNPPLPPLPAITGYDQVIGWLSRTRNDLEAAAIAVAPSISDTLAELESQAPLFARMTGSGATCFAIFPSLAVAEDAADAIRHRQPHWYVEATQTIEGRGAIT
ncbi:4-(cytidine 5'-diphospho)-2-C-methyl-D-erythritol kinase [Notoacmeibacter ruber]|uniref:4-diphosphocytidyl-2-C-methyl-D-erythritol kinase n=1 Tax=Notoacmeibacter ruber TaxID=2670375 RepID=A0A3L7JAA0_9HYPH|nr:4-(cytidine 5'-diphospho)-2-C-methyl-D-erythritol kinase [Notoacmeibacter ruber]RLQ87420.1 4-(cytidine 5'-diphospho)-2-C-methyl-D-erythritol kinase [Notoacmeibacter ruber]